MMRHRRGDVRIRPGAAGCGSVATLLSALRRHLVAGTLALLTATPCAAHHSFAMFDNTRSVTLHGTVKEFQWSNPHCYLQVLVQTDGSPVEWSVELHAPLDMYRLGWRPTTFKPGDTVTLVVNPLRDGSNGGSLVSAVDASGKSLAIAKPRS